MCDILFFFCIPTTQMRLHVRRADRQGDGGTVGVYAGESAAGSIRNIALQEEQ